MTKSNLSLFLIASLFLFTSCTIHKISFTCQNCSSEMECPTGLCWKNINYGNAFQQCLPPNVEECPQENQEIYLSNCKNDIQGNKCPTELCMFADDQSKACNQLSAEYCDHFTLATTCQDGKVTIGQGDFSTLFELKDGECPFEKSVATIDKCQNAFARNCDCCTTIDVEGINMNGNGGFCVPKGGILMGLKPLINKLDNQDIDKSDKPQPNELPDGDRPSGPPSGDRPSGPPSGDRPSGNRTTEPPSGDRPSGGRPSGPPSGNRPTEPSSESPSENSSETPKQNEKPDNNVTLSQFVANSSNVINSQYVVNSVNVVKSEHVINSQNVINSQKIKDSRNIINSSNLINCSFIVGGHNLNNVNNQNFEQANEGGKRLLTND